MLIDHTEAGEFSMKLPDAVYPAQKVHSEDRNRAREALATLLTEQNCVLSAGRI